MARARSPPTADPPRPASARAWDRCEAPSARADAERSPSPRRVSSATHSRALETDSARSPGNPCRYPFISSWLEARPLLFSAAIARLPGVTFVTGQRKLAQPGAELRVDEILDLRCGLQLAAVRPQRARLLRRDVA